MALTAREALIAIAGQLAPGVPEVTERVASAHDDPEGYVAAHGRLLARRGIDAPIPNLAWIALVDALDDHGLVAEVDWKEWWEDVVAQLRRLRSAPASPEAWAWVDEAEAAPATDERRTNEFLRLAGQGLRRTGTTLAVLDIDSDCYPLVLVPAARVGELADLATVAGFGAHELPPCRP